MAKQFRSTNEMRSFHLSISYQAKLPHSDNTIGSLRCTFSNIEVFMKLSAEMLEFRTLSGDVIVKQG